MNPFCAVLLLAYWLFAATAFCAGPVAVEQYGSRVWQTDEGLPHNSVTAITQTSDSYLWAGTAQGLVRFDGTRFKTFNLPATNGNAVVNLLTTQGGDLWIATPTGLLIVKSKSSETELLAGSHNVRHPQKLFEAPDGAVWIAALDGLFCWRDAQFATIDTNSFSAIASDGTNLWFGGNAGLFRWQEKLASVEGIGLQRGEPVTSLFCDHLGTLWIGTANRVLHRENGLTIIFDQGVGLRGSVQALHEDRAGTMWVGCANGLYRVQQSRLVPQLDEAEKPFENIFCITEDGDENLWLGTSEGMAQLRRKPFQSITRDEGLSHGNIASLVEDGVGNIWMGSVGGGLNSLRAENKQILVFDRTKDLSDSVFAITPRRGGGLWISGERTLFRFSEAGTIDYTPAFDLLECNIQALLEDATGMLWLSTCNGLRSFEKGVERHYGAGEGMPGENVRAIVEDSEGTVWFGHENGLTRRKSGRLTTFTTRDGLSTNSILSLYPDANRDLWIGTAGGGLCRYHNGVIHSYGVHDGLPSDTILEVIEDGFENLWMTTVRGVFRVRKGDLDEFDRRAISRISCLGFGKNDGMPSSQCSSIARPAALKSKDGRLWFATSRGVGVVDPSRFQKPASPPKIVIGDVIADGSRLDAQPSSGAIFRISPGRGEIEFQFAALSFQAPEKNRFRYRLEPADREWNDSGTRAVAHYNNLRPGTYTFRVQGCNSEGIWNETGASVSLILLPHFWQTKWFMGAIGIASILLVAAIARYLTWLRVRQKLSALQHQHALERERSRIAQDMHDDLGSRLTEILLVTDNIQQCRSHPERVGTQAQRVANVAREVADNLDALVWTVNPSNDSLPKLLIYLREFANNFVEPTTIRLRFDTPMEVQEIPLSSEVRHNLLLAIKEALNNTVKYRGSSEIRLSLQVETHQLIVAIEDNGKGFSPEDVVGSGNGLYNMEKRIRNVGGTFTLRSASGKGTQIQLTVPLPGHFLQDR